MILPPLVFPGQMLASKLEPTHVKDLLGAPLLFRFLALLIKNWNRLKRPAMEKHSSILQTFVKYGRKKFYTIGTGANVIKLYCMYLTNFCNKLEFLLDKAGIACQGTKHPSLLTKFANYIQKVL